MSISIVSSFPEDAEASARAFCFVGFKAMLAWHYVVLFTPLIAYPTEGGEAAYFYRQLVMYGVLTATFAVCALAGKKRDRYGSSVPSKPQIAFFGTFATAASVLACFDQEGLPLALAGLVCVAAAEGALMFLWMRSFAVRGSFDNAFVRSFAVDMMWGGAVAIVVCLFVEPVNLVAVAILPAVSAVSLALREPPSEEGRPERESRTQVADVPATSRAIGGILASAGVYALVYGLLQGAFSLEGIMVLMAIDATTIFGILVAAVVILLLSRFVLVVAVTRILHKVSLIFFAIGVLGLGIASVGENDLLVRVSEMVVFGGFNLYDFGTLTLCFILGSATGARPFFLVGVGRVVVYFCLFAGLMAGSGYGSLIMAGGAAQGFLPLACVLAIFLLLATVLFVPIGVSPGEDGSPSSDGTSSAVSEDAGASEGGASEEAALQSEQEERSACETCTVRMAAEVAEAHARSPDVDESLRESPWRRTCREIARLYRLSPRETEIFLLVAKGRNAEYVQNKLTISTHTAKTHISNIYQKLGVHSLQDLLTLIEEFRIQDIEARKRDGQ